MQDPPGSSRARALPHPGSILFVLDGDAGDAELVIETHGQIRFLVGFDDNLPEAKTRGGEVMSYKIRSRVNHRGQLVEPGNPIFLVDENLLDSVLWCFLCVQNDTVEIKLLLPAIDDNNLAIIRRLHAETALPVRIDAAEFYGGQGHWGGVCEGRGGRRQGGRHNAGEC